jgi:transaldolase
MQIFIDSADVNEISKWLAYGVIDGVTTNPTIMLKDGVYDMEKGAREIATLVGNRPVSVEVTTHDLDEMLMQAHEIAKWASNIVVKIPVINGAGEPCLGVIKALEENGVKVNATAIMSFSQVVMAAKAGATYASIFAGRVADEGHDAALLIQKARDWLDAWSFKTQIIVGSIREVINIQDAANAGAHIITIPPQFLRKMVDHKYTRSTVQGFVSDAMKAIAEMEKVRPEMSS